MAGLLSFAETIFKRIAFISIGILLTVMPMSTFCVEAKMTAVISANWLNLRAAPGKGTTPLKILEKGTPVTVLSSPDDEWIKVTDGDTVGYIINRKRYVNISETGKHLPDTGGLRQKADILQRQIKASKEKIRSYTQTESDIFQKLNKIDLTLADTRKQLRSIDRKISDFEQRINETEAVCQALKQHITKNRIYVSNRLKALYALSRLGSMNALASTANLSEFLQQKTYMESILAHDDRIRAELFTCLLIRKNFQICYESLNPKK